MHVCVHVHVDECVCVRVCVCMCVLCVHLSVSACAYAFLRAHWYCCRNRLLPASRLGLCALHRPSKHTC